jgi:phosphoglycolate phosphatase-like HAD superfamily hydrolase
MAAVGARKEETWVVGDGVQDVLAGRAAGCATVAVLGGFVPEQKLRGAEPDHVIGSLCELEPLVRSRSQ